ncbi:MAG: hypothetical protein HQ592_10780 [Planctomycetes bacterium]|nr:hypothetical protein [Planctomycetota bacterium]
MTSLAAWLDGDSKALAELGETTPVRRWLARILRHKLRLYEKHDSLGRSLGFQPSGKSGARAT